MTKWQIILEAAVVAFIVITLIINAKRGFLKTFLKTVKSIAIILLAALLTPLLVGTVSDALVEDWFKDTITPKFVETAEQAGENFNMETLSANMPDVAKNVFEMLDKDQGLTNFEGNAVEFAKELGGRIEGLITNIVSYIITYIGLSIVLWIVLSIVFKILEKVVELPVLNKVDHILGLAWGFVSAYIETSLILAVLPLFTGVELIEGTYVTRFIYEHGLFSSLLEMIL